MHDFCFTIPYGLLLLCGGVIGYLKKGSIASLAGGVGTGSLLLLAGHFSSQAFHKRKNSYFALILETVIAAILTWIMGQRYMLSGKIMPAGIVSGIRDTTDSVKFAESCAATIVVCSFIMTGYYLYKVATGGNHFPPKSE